MTVECAAYTYLARVKVACAVAKAAAPDDGPEYEREAESCNAEGTDGDSWVPASIRAAETLN